MNFVSCYRKIIGYKQTDKQTITALYLERPKCDITCVFFWTRSSLFYITPSYREKNIYFIIMLQPIVQTKYINI